MVSDNKKIKLFNRILKEFLNDFKNISNKSYKIKVDNIEYINKFVDQINTVKNDYLNCNVIVFNKIDLCKHIGLSNVELGINNCNIWKYLHNLYILSITCHPNISADEKQNVVNKSKDTLEKMDIQNLTSNIDISDLASNINNIDLSENSEMGGLVKDIAGQLNEKLKGKDLSNINPMDLISNLMSGKSDSNGIDFGDILKTTSEKIKHKVESGELDINSLKKQANMLLGSHNNKDINKDLKKYLH